MSMKVPAPEAVPYDDLIAIPDSVKYFPRPGGKKISIPTIYRYTMSGCRGIRLRTVSAGGVLATRPSWIAQFIDALTTERLSRRGPVAQTPSSSTTQVAAQLDAIGI